MRLVWAGWQFASPFSFSPCVISSVCLTVHFSQKKKKFTAFQKKLATSKQQAVPIFTITDLKTWTQVSHAWGKFV